MSILWPLSGRITSPFGDRTNRTSPHSGTDIYGSDGAAIAAGLHGKVHYAAYHNSRAGNVVTIEYPVKGGTLTAMYCHVQARYPVRVGSTVRAGQTIAYVGRSGTSRGGHTHIECYLNGRLVNPEHYFGGTTPAGGGSTPIGEDDMSAEAESRIGAIYAALFGPRNIGSTKPLSWLNIDGSAQNTKYGVLPIILHNQTLIARQAGQLAALSAAVNALAVGEGVDPATILAAARDGAAEALAEIDVPAVDTAAIVEAVREAIAAQGVTVDLSALEATLDEQFAAVNANIDEIPLGFEITPK